MFGCFLLLLTMLMFPFVNANPTSFPASCRLYTVLASDVMGFIFLFFYKKFYWFYTLEDFQPMIQIKFLKKDKFFRFDIFPVLLFSMIMFSLDTNLCKTSPSLFTRKWDLSGPKQRYKSSNLRMLMWWYLLFLLVSYVGRSSLWYR